MDRLFNIVIVGLLRNQRTIAKAIAEGVAQFRKLRSFFLLGWCGSHNQHQGNGWGWRIDLGDGYLAAKFPDQLQ